LTSKKKSGKNHLARWAEAETALPIETLPAAEKGFTGDYSLV